MVDSTIRIRQLNQPELSGFVNPIVSASIHATGNLTGVFYPRTSNPSGYISSGQTGNFTTQADLDNLYYKTVTYVGGNYYPASNPSGYASVHPENFVNATGNQTISGVKNFISRPTVNGSEVMISGDPLPLPTSNNSITITTVSDSATNGVTLLNTYAQAKALIGLSTSNRFTIFLSPGIYDLGTSELVLDTSFIDIIGLDTNCNGQYIHSDVGVLNSAVIRATNSNTDYQLHNLKVENTNDTFSLAYANNPAAFYPSTNSGEKIFNVSFVADGVHVTSTRLQATFAGYYENCSVGLWGFGGFNGTASGKFVKCIGLDFCFGGDGGTASGTFIDCTGGIHGFGGAGGTASGHFKDCVGLSNCFGYNGTASGEFINCSGGDSCFGSGGIASGEFRNCKAGNYSFAAFGSASGRFDGCFGESSFGSGGNTFGGIFINCTGTYDSFAGNGGTANGTFINCFGGDSSFGGQYGHAEGVFTNCTGGNYSFGGGGGAYAIGTFINCVAGVNSFGGLGTTTGAVFINCSAGDNSFNI